MTFNYAIVSSAVSRGWSSYLAFLLKGFGIILPKWLYEIKLNSYIVNILPEHKYYIRIIGAGNDANHAQRSQRLSKL
jgi:hypothetical protein